MDDLERKRDLLSNTGFSYDFRREIYINRPKREIVSLEFIEDHTPEELACLLSGNKSDNWKFYFNTLPSESTMQQILDKIEQ